MYGKVPYMGMDVMVFCIFCSKTVSAISDPWLYTPHKVAFLQIANFFLFSQKKYFSLLVREEDLLLVHDDDGPHNTGGF